MKPILAGLLLCSLNAHAAVTSFTFSATAIANGAGEPGLPLNQFADSTYTVNGKANMSGSSKGFSYDSKQASSSASASGNYFIEIGPDTIESYTFTHSVESQSDFGPGEPIPGTVGNYFTVGATSIVTLDVTIDEDSVFRISPKSGLPETYLFQLSSASGVIYSISGDQETSNEVIHLSPGFYNMYSRVISSISPGSGIGHQSFSPDVRVWIDPVSVPEPASMLLASGCAGLVFRRRRH